MKNRIYILLLIPLLFMCGCVKKENQIDTEQVNQLQYNNYATNVKEETCDFQKIKKEVLSKIFVRYTNNERYCLFTYEQTEFIPLDDTGDNMLHIIYPKNKEDIEILKNELNQYIQLIDVYKINHKQQVYLIELINTYIDLLFEVEKIEINDKYDKIYFYDNNVTNENYMNLRNKIIQKIYQE